MSQSAYYLLTSGEVRQKADQFRAATIRLLHELHTQAKSWGASQVSIDERMMKLTGCVFDGKPPQGWTVPSGRHGLSRPKKRNANAEALKHFTPTGVYLVERHPELQPFYEWLACPESYSYTKENGCWGSCCIGHPLRAVALAWYSADGPILLMTPDFERAKQQAAEDGHTPDAGSLDWTPPDGCERILLEKWNLMQAEALS